MPFLNAGAFSLFDVVLLLVILVGLPVEAQLSRGRMKDIILSGRPGARRRLYIGTMLMLWGLTLPILLAWRLGGRDWGDLGFRFESGWSSLAGWSLAALTAAVFHQQYLAVKTRPDVRRKMREEFEKAGEALYFMPRTKDEHSLFRLTGITAGITEEVLFRGYLLWALGLIMPLWLAAAISLAVFVFLHLYQGVSQLVPVFVLGAIMTATVILSGSLWPAIALHVLVDVLNNDTLWLARNAETGDGPAPGSGD